MGGNSKYKKEIEYIKKHGKIVLFPYDFTETYNKDEVYPIYDEKNSMCYVIHKHKKLYFPKSLSMQSVKKVYNTLLCEQDYDSPHRYFSEDYQVEEGEVMVDVGCAEAMMSLNNIEKLSYLFLIESDSEWEEALKLTFEPWKEKVSIINKIASENDNEKEVSLDTLLTDIDCQKITIKMDVEGYEKQVFKGAQKLFKTKKIKCVCATYHKQADGEELENMFEKIQYDTEFSKGYMLFIYGVEAGNYLSDPYFRKGVLRAKNY